jgi:hypothetical protein
MSGTNLVQVTEQQFYDAIGPMNVHGSIVNAKWPYITEFTLGHGREVIGRRISEPKTFELASAYVRS